MIVIIVSIKKSPQSFILGRYNGGLPWQCQCVFHIINYYYISSVPRRHLGTEHFKIKDLSNFWGTQHGRSLG